MTASTTTMASSTTIPDGEHQAEHRERVDEKPRTGKKMNVPTRETGMVSSGMTVARTF